MRRKKSGSAGLATGLVIVCLIFVFGASAMGRGKSVDITKIIVNDTAVWDYCEKWTYDKKGNISGSLRLKNGNDNSAVIDLDNLKDSTFELVKEFFQKNKLPIQLSLSVDSQDGKKRKLEITYLR